MVAQTLWIEITIAGGFYVCSLVLFIMAAYGIGTPKDVAAIREYLPYVAVVFVGLSYIVGIIMHRLIQAIAGPMFSFIERLFKLGVLARDHASDAETHYARLVEIWQVGSERLHRELDFQFALIALLHSLLFSLPLLACALIVWLTSLRYSGHRVVLGVLLPFWFLAFVAYRRQRLQFKQMQRAAIAGVRRVPAKL